MSGVGNSARSFSHVFVASVCLILLGMAELCFATSFAECLTEVLSEYCCESGPVCSLTGGIKEAVSFVEERLTLN